MFQKVWDYATREKPCDDSSQDDMRNCDLAKEFAVWHFDQWLPAVAGKGHWGESIRHCQCVDDDILIKNEMKVAVPISTEAFGMLMLENCRDKWTKHFEFKSDVSNEDKQRQRRETRIAIHGSQSAVTLTRAR